jgi:hypothetical protein
MRARHGTALRRSVVGLALLGLAATGSPAAVGNAQVATPNAVRVNFQPASAPAAPYFAEPTAGTSSTYLVDSGQPFGARTGFTYGWVTPGGSTGADLTANTRDRGVAGVPQRLDTLIHMQPPATRPAERPGSWEMAVPNGKYTVVVAAGDPAATDSVHRLRVEGVVAVDAFTPSATERSRSATRHVTVSDGRLTVDASGGTNTKLAYLELYSGHRPYLTAVDPTEGRTGVLRTGSISADLQVVAVGQGVDPATLTAANVRLVREDDGQRVTGTAGTSGGNDVVNFQSAEPLAASTAYRFEVGFGVRDETGAPFVPFWSTFRTGTELPPSTSAAFTRVAQPAVPARFYTSVVTGPDGRLYAATSEGSIFRFDVAANGTLSNPLEITSLRAAGPRLLIGMAFAPGTSPTQPVLWVSHSTYGFAGMPDWGGTISRLSGPNLGTVTDEVVKLPRSAKDHLVNSLAFGPDGALYTSQGANTAAGDLDPQWANRPERLLTAAILRIDVAALTDRGPLDVQTAELPTGVAPYDPAAPGAPVTVHASGVRNAYDLVWADNGQLYTAINGTGGNAIAPAIPSPLPASCAARLVNGQPYTATTATGRVDALPVQPDLAARIVKGGYYGNPNPSRCEWILNGGNPTAGVDRLEVVPVGGSKGYAVGVAPDPNWRSGQIHPLGRNLSPNGMVQYTGPAAELNGQLLVTAFSNCDCILVLTRNAAGEITGQREVSTGTFDFQNPLDIAQGPGGRLFVSNRTDLGTTTGTIELLVPAGG